ncbi:MAG: HTH domain-containing protein, partial [Merdibacter sp.]|nr:HTH domain-containing protein [Merdibacter sp.]
MNSITNRQAEILKELSKSNILTSEQLANILHVSSRTIRNDIHVINQIFPDSISVLPSSGYRLQNKTILQKLHHDHYSEENGDTLDFKVLKKILSVSESNIDDL